MTTTRVMGADALYRWAYYIVGVNVPRRFIRSLTMAKRIKLFKYIEYMWLAASDNNVRRVHRPKWCPKKYIYGRSS